MTKPTKQERAEVILQCAKTIAAYYETTTMLLLSPVSYKAKEIQDARNAFVYHLHACGMSRAAIGRILQRSTDCVERRRAVGVKAMNGDDFDMIRSLPRIPSSLVITTKEGT